MNWGVDTLRLRFTVVIGMGLGELYCRIVVMGWGTSFFNLDSTPLTCMLLMSFFLSGKG